MVTASMPSESAIARAAAAMSSRVCAGRRRPGSGCVQITVCRLGVVKSYSVLLGCRTMHDTDVHSTSISGVTASGLGKRFDDLWALRDVDLDVPAGTVLGLLGHNGAGKTTAIRILTTLALPTTGRATVDGLDVVTESAKVRTRIGLAGQAT